jgi:hypothetical protein
LAFDAPAEPFLPAGAAFFALAFVAIFSNVFNPSHRSGTLSLNDCLFTQHANTNIILFLFSLNKNREYLLTEIKIKLLITRSIFRSFRKFASLASLVRICNPCPFCHSNLPTVQSQKGKRDLEDNALFEK